MQEQYGVSVNTTTQAIQCLQKWGVVEATRGKGIFVSTNIKALNDIHVEPKLIASHLRRYFDSLELLSLTAEGVASQVAVHVSSEDIQAFIQRLDEAKNYGNLYQPAPVILLEFLTEHIPYEACGLSIRLYSKTIELAEKYLN